MMAVVESIPIGIPNVSHKPLRLDLDILRGWAVSPPESVEMVEIVPFLVDVANILFIQVGLRRAPVVFSEGSMLEESIDDGSWQETIDFARLEVSLISERPSRLCLLEETEALRETGGIYPGRSSPNASSKTWERG